MSKEALSKIKDSELRCYVCDNLIHILKRVRTLANCKNDDYYYTDKALALRHKANMTVIEITGSFDKQRVFRHNRCNPNLKHFTIGDL